MKKSLLAVAALMTLFLTACGETKKEPSASAPASEASAPAAASTPVEASAPVAASTTVEASAPVAASAASH